VEGGISRLEAALERLREKEADYSDAARLKEYGDIIMANMHLFPSRPDGTEPATASFTGRDIPAAYAKRPSRSADSGAKDDLGMPARSAFGCRLSLLEAEDFYSGGGIIRITVDPQKGAAENAAVYYGQYRKAKNGLDGVREAIAEAEAAIARQKELLAELLKETNPFRLQKLAGGAKREAGREAAGKTCGKRPGLTFRRDGWLMIVGRSAKENDELLRRHVKGNDLWLHARDAAGSYVFIKQRPGKTVPLPVLLDAANLALFYSKGRASGRGELFYTQAKYLRRAKIGPKGLVIPTQEKNLSVTLDDRRLKELEGCRE
jgi:predicted ribosome quality control (RQC) complex YloA/Tae2 family protein